LGTRQDVVRFLARFGKRRACSASLRPCSIRSRRSSSIRETGLNANVQIRAKNTMKFSALTITQNRLTWNSAAPPSAVA
jgi:hypothetical protein